MERDVIIFTDLDGTFIDHSTYSFEALLPALSLIKKHRIPLIFCSSKTRAEIEEYRKETETYHPFISENGGAVFIPKDYFIYNFEYTGENPAYKIIELGVPHKILCQVLKDISEKLRCNIKGLSDMSPEEISRDFGLNLHQAELSKKREYDEPFIIEDDKKLWDKVLKEIEKKGFRHTKGGRFFHITGENDKGKAVEILTAIYKKENSRLKTIGLGDSSNDRPLLESVDLPALVQKPDGTHDPNVDVKGVTRVDGIGPVGWKNYIMDYLSKDYLKKD